MATQGLACYLSDRNEREVVYDVILIYFMYRITIDMHGSCTNGYHKTTAYKVSLTVKKVHVGCTKIAIMNDVHGQNAHYSHYTMQLLYRKAQGWGEKSKETVEA